MTWYLWLALGYFAGAVTGPIVVLLIIAWKLPRGWRPS